MICNACNANNHDSSKFCLKCGVLLINPIVPNVSLYKQCPKCGASNAIEAKFCKVDGYQFEQIAEGQSSESDFKIDSPSLSTNLPSVRSGLKRNIVVGLSLFLLLVGGFSGYVYYTGKFIEPMALQTEINAKLKANGNQSITASVNQDRVVTLSGTVNDASAIETAVSEVRSIKGVKDVNSNLGTPPSVFETENLIAKKLKEQQLNEVYVKVDETRNAVLFGSVTEDSILQLATNIALKTLGVKSVDNSRVQVTSKLEIKNSNKVHLDTTPMQNGNLITKDTKRIPKSENVTAIETTPVPAKPSTSHKPVSSPLQMPLLVSCDSLKGVFRLMCRFEGSPLYFKCAPDGRNWNHTISGCDRRGTQSAN